MPFRVDRRRPPPRPHHYGPQNDESHTVNKGNKDPHRGFGHICISVDHIQAACNRIEQAGYKFQKKLTDGRMKNIAFALDPDGYWVEIVSLKIGTKGADDPNEPTDPTATDPTTYRMVCTHTHTLSLSVSLSLSLFCFSPCV